MNIPKDKLLHFCVGAISQGALQVVARLIGIEAPVIFAFALTTLIAASKEIYDKASGKGTPEWADFFVTLWGGLVVALPSIFLLEY